MTASAAAPSPPARPAASGACGAYGLRLRGVEAARGLLGPELADWPAYELSTRTGGAHAPLQWVRANDALVRLAAGGRVAIDRLRGRAVFTMTTHPTAEELVHPYMASVAAVAARWLGRESFHAGAVAADGGAWVVLGDKGAGKSSLLAGLSLAGHAIVTDDVAILDRHGAVHAGPRLIDLRAEAAARLGVGRPLGVVGLRERWRLSVDAVPATLPLRGFVKLTWGEETSIARVPVARRVGQLVEQRVIRRLPPRDPALLLELGALPMLELRRPREWDAAAEAGERLLDALHGTA